MSCPVSASKLATERQGRFPTLLAAFLYGELLWHSHPHGHPEHFEVGLLTVLLVTEQNHKQESNLLFVKPGLTPHEMMVCKLIIYPVLEPILSKELPNWPSTSDLSIFPSIYKLWICNFILKHLTGNNVVLEPNITGLDIIHQITFLSITFFQLSTQSSSAIAVRWTSTVTFFSFFCKRAYY